MTKVLLELALPRMQRSFAQALMLNTIPAVASILEVVCRATGARLAVIALVTDKQWIACSVRDELQYGLKPGDVLDAELRPCFEIKEHERPVVIGDLAIDPTHADNPVLNEGRFRSYISAPIMLAEGNFFGTLCAFDPTPANLDRPEIVSLIKLLAGLVADQIDTSGRADANADALRRATTRLDVSETHLQDARDSLATSEGNLAVAADRLAVSDAALLDARATAELREQFVAVLGHDLRNPLAAINAGIDLLLRTPLNDRAQTVVGMMQKSVVRMNELVLNMLDLARIRLGGGITLDRHSTRDLEQVLHQIVDELHAKWPDRGVETQFAMVEPIHCDPNRIAQLFSNLLANALTHGAADQPIRINATAQGGVFELAVANGGIAMPPAVMEQLFKPFVRGGKNVHQGLGLGLYIAAEIARAHSGTLTVTSTAENTCFVLTLPTKRAAMADATTSL